MDGPFICLDSGLTLRANNGELKCLVSGKAYPVVGGIPILVEHPDSLIRGYNNAWDRMRQELRAEAENLSDLRRKRVRPGWISRAEQQLYGKGENLKAVARYMEPMEIHANGKARLASSITDVLSVYGSGWGLDLMLPYFAQDWTDSPDFLQVSRLLAGSIEKYAIDRQAIAVLGTGACGIAHSCLRLFEHVYGVDLSLPTLLLSQGVMRGDRLSLRLQQTAWQPIEVHPREVFEGQVTLVVADANRLPFSSGQLSVVVTQYLMDLMVDPVATAREIRRVLKPGGIWVNFSNPFIFHEEERRFGSVQTSEMDAVLSHVGFSVPHCDSIKFNHLNFAHLHPDGLGVPQTAHHFVAFSATNVPATEGNYTTSNLKRASSPAWWKQVVHRVPSRTVESRARKAVASNGNITSYEIGVSGDFLPIDSATLRFFETLLGAVDGKRTVKDIYRLTEPLIPDLGTEEFASVVVLLSRNFGVLRLEASNPIGSTER